jgi:hypothetical protein
MTHRAHQGDEHAEHALDAERCGRPPEGNRHPHGDVAVLVQGSNRATAFTAHGPTDMTRQFTVNQNGSFLSIPVLPTVKPLSNSNAVTGQASGKL